MFVSTGGCFNEDRNLTTSFRSSHHHQIKMLICHWQDSPGQCFNLWNTCTYDVQSCHHDGSWFCGEWIKKSCIAKLILFLEMFILVEMALLFWLQRSVWVWWDARWYLWQYTVLTLLSGRLWYLQYVNCGDTSALYLAIDIYPMIKRLSCKIVYFVEFI